MLAEIGSGAQATVHVCVKLDDFEKHEHHASQCQLFAAKVVKKKSLLRRHRKKKNVLDGKEDTGKKGTYGLATGQIAREIAVLKRMRHNNIVKIIEVLDDPDEDTLFVVMEYLADGPLFPDWDPYCHADKRFCPLDEDEARNIFRDIGLAMSYMHAQNVVHYDIKPSNILLVNHDAGTAHGAKLADFGVAHIFADDDQEESMRTPMVGTPLFRPPEILLSDLVQKQLSQPLERVPTQVLLAEGCAGDVWSYGVSLYLSVMGRPPFSGNNLAELAESVCHGTLSFDFDGAPTLSDSCKAFLSKVLDKDTKRRYTSAELLVDPWLTKNGSLPALKLSKQDSDPIIITDDEVSRALTLVMRNFGFVAFSTKWMLHARKHLDDKKHAADVPSDPKGVSVGFA